MNVRLLEPRFLLILSLIACLPLGPARVAQAEIQEPSALQRFTSRGHVLGFDSAGYFASNGTYALRVRFEGASGGSGSVVGNATDTEVSRSTAREVPEFQGIAYTDVWPGIDVEYDAPKGGIARSTWTVAPGVSPGAIRLRYNRPVVVSGDGCPLFATRKIS